MVVALAPYQIRVLLIGTKSAFFVIATVQKDFTALVLTATKIVQNLLLTMGIFAVVLNTGGGLDMHGNLGMNWAIAVCPIVVKKTMVKAIVKSVC